MPAFGGEDVEVVEEEVHLRFEAEDVGAGGAGGVFVGLGLEEVLWADVEGVGDLEDAAEGGHGCAAFPVAPVAEVDADEFGGLALGERRVVFLA
jgi:hypothetical protein